jgi:hypothetical protein
MNLLSPGLLRAAAVTVFGGACFACGGEEPRDVGPGGPGSGGSSGSAGTGAAGSDSGGAGGNAGASMTGGTAGAVSSAGAVGSAGAGGSGAMDGGGVPTNCAQLATLVCRHYAQCAPYYLPLDFGTESECVDRVRSICNHFQSGGTGLDMAACAGALQAPHCAGIAAARGVPAECLQPRGPQRAGSPCNWDFDCESLLCTGNGAGCGVCGSRRGDGEQCDDRNVCELDLACVGGMCVRAAGPGEACGPAVGCVAGATCAQGACLAWGGIGATCSPAAPCNGPHGAVCSNGTCVEALLADLGKPCGAEIVTNCRAGTFCGAVSCEVAANLGAACGMGTSCSFPLFCANGVCSYEGTSVCR